MDGKIWAGLCGVFLLAGLCAEDIEKLDRNMAVPMVKEDGITWYSPQTAPFRLAGFAWFDKDRLYRRLPAKRKEIPSIVNYLADHTAGGQISFRSNTRRLLVRVKLQRETKMFHMPPTGHSGFDLYQGKPGEKKFCSTAFPKMKDGVYQAQLYQSKSRDWNEFTLNFPLYNGVSEVLIGLDDQAEIAPPTAYASDKKIVIYGGSSLQGACASRPGTCHMNIISRKLNMEVINLGFSGSGKMEPEMAEIIGEITNPAVIIIEAERNTGYDGVVAKLEKFIRILKKHHPDVPVVIMSANKRPAELIPGWTIRENILAFMRGVAEKMKGEGVYLFDSSDLLGEDYYECTVDGLHPTDLGFYRMAEGFTPYLDKIINIKAGE